MFARVALPVALAILVTLPAPSRAGFVNRGSTLRDLWQQPTWGAQAIDLDLDGDIDLVRGHHAYSTRVHTNDGTGRFVNQLPQLITHPADRHGFLFADFDNDGLPDAVCSHGGEGGCGCPSEGTELWCGAGSAGFSIVTNAGGMRDDVDRGRAFSAADIDLDGDLDLFHGKAPLLASPNALFRNDGGMSFVDLAPALGVDEVAGTVGGLFADYDDDGDADLLVGGEEFLRPTILWRNDGARFVNATASAFGSLPVVSGADWGDYDGDGDLDLAICEGAEGVHDSWGTEGGTFWFFVHHRLGENGVDEITFDTSAPNITAELRALTAVVDSLVFLGPNRVPPSTSVVSGNQGPPRSRASASRCRGAR